MKSNHILKENCLFRRPIIAELVRSVFVFLVTLALSQLIAELINKAVLADTSAAFMLSGITMAVLLCSLPFIFAMNKRVQKERYDTTQQYRDSLYSNIITGALPVSSEGDLSVKLGRDVNTVTDYLFTVLPDSISAIIILFAVSVICFLIDPLIAVIFIGISLLQIVPTLFYENWARKAYKEVHEDEETYKSWLVEGFRGMQTLKAYGKESWFIRRFSLLNRQVLLSGIRAERVVTWETVIQETIGIFITYGNYLIVGSFAFIGKIELQDIPILIILGEYIFSSVSSLYEMRVARFEYKEASERLIFAEKERSYTDAPDIIAQMQHVSKSFDGKAVLKDVSLQIKRSSHFLFLGDNGSGKSTLFNILGYYYSADKGIVLQKKGLRLTYVAQEDAALPFTVTEMADALIRQGIINKEAFLSNVAGFGLEKEALGQPIASLSEGQRKKVFLCFALAKDTELLILDEPTNHLDLAGVDYLLSVLRRYDGALLLSGHDSRIHELKWDRVYSLCGGQIDA